jgi:hypothetical protein
MPQKVKTETGSTKRFMPWKSHILVGVDSVLILPSYFKLLIFANKLNTHRLQCTYMCTTYLHTHTIKAKF